MPDQVLRTGPRFLTPSYSSVPTSNDTLVQTAKTLCGCQKLCGLALTRPNPSLVPSLLGMKTLKAYGGRGGKLKNYLILV